MAEYQKICEYCNKNFIANRKDKRFCSDKCRDANRRQKEEYKIKARKRASQWYQNNKEYANYKSTEYIKLHPEQRKETARRYFYNHEQEELSQRDAYLRSHTSYEEYDDYAICCFNGTNVIVDLEDLERIKTKNWCVIKDKYEYVKSHDLTLRLHRFIMRCDNPNLSVHHIDNNQLNNRKSNLIILTHAQHSHLHRYQEKIGKTLTKQEILKYFNIEN